ncbi:MAG: AsmA family protein [Acidaminococcales bacterium]|jgi:hypothetical protein|nr:AsmA family protein [Acidaminococcales bacterium]
MPIKNFNFSGKHKIISVAVIAAFLLLFGFVSWAGGKAAVFIKEQAAKQDFLEGTVSIGDVRAAFSGDVWLSDIVWKDPDGKLVANIPSLNISVRLRDILSTSFGVGSIQTITLERPELYLSYDPKGGLNVLRLIKVKENQSKSAAWQPAGKPGEAVGFRGTLEIARGLLEIVSGESRLRYENLESKLSYASFPKTAGVMQAKQNKADLAGKFEINHDPAGNKIDLQIEGRSLALRDFFEMIPVKSNVKILEGNIDTLQATITARGDEPLKMRAQGDFSNIKGEAASIALDSFKGAFSGSQEEIVFTNVSGRLNGQPVGINGKVVIKSEPYKLDVKIASDAFRIDALSPGMGINAPLAFNADITGAPDAPQAKGSFSVASLKTEQLELINGRGNFRYDKGVLNIYDASAGAYGGIVNANGAVKLDEKSFAFNLKGSGLNSTAMTETKIQGPLSFNARATGAGDPSAAAAAGSFAIGKGDFNGIPFNSLTGDFNKKGDEMFFSNITIDTLAGVAHTNASVSTGGKIKFDNIDVNTIKKQTVEDKIKSRTGKITDAIKKIF